MAYIQQGVGNIPLRFWSILIIGMIASRSCCRFVGCTSVMWISRSTTSQRCSVGLRSGDCGGHLSKVNSLSCSRNQSERIWALWQCIILLEVAIRRWVTVVIMSCSLHQILTLPSECRSRNRDSSDEAKFLKSMVQFWWACAICCLRFLFLADRSSTRCGLLLL